MSKNLTLLVGLAIGLGVLSGCVSRADIEEIKATQKDILAKIDKIKAAPAAPATRRPEKSRLISPTPYHPAP